MIDVDATRNCAYLRNIPLRLQDPFVSIAIIKFVCNDEL